MRRGKIPGRHRTRHSEFAKFKVGGAAKGGTYACEKMWKNEGGSMTICKPVHDERDRGVKPKGGVTARRTHQRFLRGEQIYQPCGAHL